MTNTWTSAAPRALRGRCASSRRRHACASTLAWAVPLLMPTAAIASFGGKIDIGFGTMFIAAALGALPGAVVCLATEWKGATSRPPYKLGILSLIAGTIALACVIFVRPDSTVPGAATVALPPLMTFALVTLLPAPMWRLAAVWLVTWGSIWLIMTAHSSASASDSDTLRGGLLGGALTHMVLWHAGFVLGQLARRTSGAAPPKAPDVRRMLDASARALTAIDAPRRGASALLRVHPGYWWWIGGSALFFFAMLAWGMFDTTLLQSAIRLSYRWRATFGPSWVGAPTATFARLWLVDGVFWSLIVGAGVWGLAGALRRFDAGRLAPLRWAAVVVSAVMLVWLAEESSTISRIAADEIRARSR
jgi:hypothetical protein